MENNTTTIENLIEKVQSYYKTTLELYKYEAVRKMADIFSDLTAKLILTIVVVLFLLFTEIGLSLFLGDYFGKLYYGFIFVGVLNLCIGLLLLVLKDKWIKTPIRNAFIRRTKIIDSL